MKTLKIDGSFVEVGDDVARAKELIETEYGGKLLVLTGHKVGPVAAFEFPDVGAVQICVRLNKGKTTFYLRERCPNGRPLTEEVVGLSWEKRYTSDSDGIINTIKSGKVPYLRPSREHPVIRVSVESGQLSAVLEAAIRGSSGKAILEPAGQKQLNTVSSDARPERAHAPRSPEDLLAQLDRNSVLGAQGEEVAMAYEVERLRSAGCPEPARHVMHIALDDVASGYDIESDWEGERRFIEVKTSSQRHADFFVTANEFKVLKLLGQQAWLYRVAPKGEALAVVETIRDPINVLAEERFTTHVWRVKALE